MPGDMGHACGAVLRKNGFRVVTALNGRTQRTKSLAIEAAIDDVGNLEEVVQQSDLILSILPPQHAYSLAKKVLNWQPRIKRDKGILKTFEYFKALPKAKLLKVANKDFSKHIKS